MDCEEGSHWADGETDEYRASSNILGHHSWQPSPTIASSVDKLSGI